MSDCVQPCPPGLTVLPAGGTCFRTWRLSRGPLRSFIRDGQHAHSYWLQGPCAALWEALEPGITLGRLHRRAVNLQIADRLTSLLQEWRGAGLIDIRGGTPRGAPRKSVHGTDDVTVSGAGEPPSATHGTPFASLTSASTGDLQQWMRTQGLPFSAFWALDRHTPDLRKAMERLDFLRHSGVFQICFTTGTRRIENERHQDRTPTVRDIDPHAEHILIAARAQGFECLGPDQ